MTLLKMIFKSKIKNSLLASALAIILAACSTTKAIPDGEQLFTGLNKINFEQASNDEYAMFAKEEMESVLATTPTGALFGSSYYRTPFPIRLWIWNAFANDTTAVGKWMIRAFATKPKLLSRVNPELRKSVGEMQLKKMGFLQGKVNYKIVTKNNPKKAKIAYTVNFGHLYKIDTIQYLNFTPTADSLIRTTKSEAYIKKGEPFKVAALEAERQRVTQLLRNNGYFYAKPTDASFLADTLQKQGKVVLRFQEADSLEHTITHKWYIGRVHINLFNNLGETLTDSLQRSVFTLRYRGNKSPLRPAVFYMGLKLHPTDIYQLEKQEAATDYLHATGLFNYTSFRFTPRKNSLLCDTLDLDLDCVLDKKYSFYVNANAKGKTSNRMGPELVLGLTKINALRGGEKLDINVHGSYEWQTGHKAEGSTSQLNSYEYGGDVSLVFPRIMTPENLIWTPRKRTVNDTLAESKPKPQKTYHFYGIPTTTIRLANNILNRAGYYKRHVVSADLTYQFRTTQQAAHEFSPLILSYEYMTSQTDVFRNLLTENPYLQISMRNQFVPKMSYTYHYNSLRTYRNPVTWKTTISEAANLLSLGYVAAGERWNEKNKKMFKNPFAQFVKIETDITKQWRIGIKHALVAHLNAGMIYSYGNATEAPYYEQFYVGGANSIRAFNVRSIGPGKYQPLNKRMSYVEQTGDIKFLTNLEFRPHLFGDVYGALFVDAGNVWTMQDYKQRQGGTLQWKSFLNDIAIGTGIGIRYDMGLFVIRVDWGVGLHVPYSTSRKGFYNIPSLKDGNSIHLAIGYPF